MLAVFTPICLWKKVSELWKENSSQNQLYHGSRIASEMLEPVLKCNNFTFNRKHFLQVNGTAMSTRVAPTYANLFMAYFEEKHMYT